MDDCLVSTASEEEALVLCHELVSICSKGVFKLTKWISNRHAVMAAIPEDQRAKGIKNLDLDHDTLSVERVVGVQWCIQSDVFKFKIVVQDKKRDSLCHQFDLRPSRNLESHCPLC